ncbi:cupin domain-containing protein [Nostoc sp. CENA67]|uniref:Cupin domain-containing protein n=1 Tax=Amazonocrinis nigriterrae CENA67 TaxID=2794033 RepID=A0A8J7HU10_9NOST|nr:cupin domain-containing protein [Amazonocrinis nigriterrae]MBH8563477.1 cupin domain-containing protein [Amazonocrinis nigriterrae CENA67]
MIATSLNDLPEESVSHNPEITKKVMLRFGDLPYLTNFSQARFSPGQTASAHAHQDMCEVFFVQAGAGVIRVDSKEYPLLPGNCIAIEPGKVHEIINSGSDELVLTYFGLQVS